MVETMEKPLSVRASAQTGATVGGGSAVSHGVASNPCMPNGWETYFMGAAAEELGVRDLQYLSIKAVSPQDFVVAAIEIQEAYVRRLYLDAGTSCEAGGNPDAAFDHAERVDDFFKEARQKFLPLTFN